MNRAEGLAIGVTCLSIAGIIFCLASMGQCSELPTAPSHSPREPVETYGPDERMIVHNSPAHAERTPNERNERIFYASFWLIHGIHAGAIAFDLTETSRGVANGCTEASSNLGPHPTTGRIVGVGLAEFAGILAFDAGLKAVARHNHLPKWFAVSLGSIGASVATFKHIEGGIDWTQTGCI